LLFALAVSLVSAVLCAIARRSVRRDDVNTSLKDQSRAATAGRSHSRLRTSMVSAEIALLCFSCWNRAVIRGIFLIDHQDLGFRPDHLLTASVTLDHSHYNDDASQSVLSVM